MYKATPSVDQPVTKILQQFWKYAFVCCITFESVLPWLSWKTGSRQFSLFTSCRGMVNRMKLKMCLLWQLGVGKVSQARWKVCSLLLSKIILWWEELILSTWSWSQLVNIRLEANLIYAVYEMCKQTSTLCLSANFCSSTLLLTYLLLSELDIFFFL